MASFLTLSAKGQEDLIDPRDLIFISERLASKPLNGAVGALITSFKA